MVPFSPEVFWHLISNKLNQCHLTTRGKIMKKMLLFFVMITNSAPVFASDTGLVGYVCVGGYLYKPDSSNTYVGTSECKSAVISGNYACVNGYLHTPDNNSSYVGSSDCKRAKIGNGYACVGGYLYKPNGEKNYVGNSDCESANLGN